VAEFRWDRCCERRARAGRRCNPNGSEIWPAPRQFHHRWSTTVL
jgi:hypothetical protein